MLLINVMYIKCAVILADIKTGLQYLFQTKRHLILAIRGSGWLDAETILTNLLAPNETFLGNWNEWAYEADDHDFYD